MASIEIDPGVSGLLVAVIRASEVAIAPASAELREYCDQCVAEVVKCGPAGGDDRRLQVRGMLRAGGFKPAGRNKPAQEYLLRTVEKQQSLPEILNVVDLLNAISLRVGLPISMLAADRLGENSLLRYGGPGENFTFNRAGQELNLAGLICWCSVGPDGSTPLGSPVKDSMAGKVTEADRGIAVCIYAPAEHMTDEELRRVAEEFGDGLVRWCGASRFEIRTCASGKLS